jgi:hypothetical protein
VADRDPVRYLFLRMEQTVDGSGEWTVELSDCRRRVNEGGHGMHRYEGEAEARTAVAAIYALSRHLMPLPTRDPQHREPPRWRVRAYDPV